MSIDPIKRRLRELDEERIGLWEKLSVHIFAENPLTICACGMVCGIILYGLFANSVIWMLGVIALAFVSLCVGAVCKEQRRVWMLGLGVLFIFTCLGGLRLEGFYRLRENDIRYYVSTEEVPATIRGMVISRVYQEDRDKWEFGRYVWGDPSSSFYVKLFEADFENGWDKVSGIVRVQATGKVEHVNIGDVVEIYCWLDRFDGPSNPGQFDAAKYMRQRGVYVAATVKSAGGIGVIENDNANIRFDSKIRKFRNKLKLLAESSLLGEGYWEQNDRGLAAALLLGNRGNIDNVTYEAFARTGLAHFISLSGLHMGLLAGMVWWLCRSAGLGKKWRAIVTIAIIGVYVLVLPPRAPTIRAAVMCWVFCAGVLAGRKCNSINALSLAAIILVLIRPTDVFNAGWQLSFSTVLGIILLQKRIHGWITDAFYNKFEFLRVTKHKSRWGYYAAGTFNYFTTMLSVGLSAWVGGAGVLLFNFGTLTPSACIWTAVVFPVVAVLLGVGYLQIITSFLLPTVSIGLGIVVEKVGVLLSVMVRVIAHIDRTQISVGKVSIGIVLVYYVGLFVLMFVRIRGYYRQRWIIAAAVCMMLVPTIVVGTNKKFNRDFELTCLDIGHGQAIVISTPKGEHILIDAGSLTSKNCGQRIVVPFLKEKGIDRLDAVFITHDDIDHLNGLPEIIETVPVEGIYVNEGFMEKTQTKSTAGYMREWLAEMRKDFELVDAGIEKIEGVGISEVWPSKDICERADVSDNDKSLVLLVEYAECKILVCGDIETLGQRGIFELNPGIEADVVVMAHHGSNANLINGFYERLNPEVMIGSCSKGRYESVYKNEDIESYYTSVEGAVAVKVSAGGKVLVSGYKF